MMFNSGIEVQKDGLKLGWNIAAALASFGLALYVSLVINPLKEDTVDLEEKVRLYGGRILELEREVRELRATISKHETADWYEHKATTNQINRIMGIGARPEDNSNE